MEKEVLSFCKLACAQAVFGSIIGSDRAAGVDSNRNAPLALQECHLVAAVTSHISATCLVQVVMMTGGEVQCPISLETNPLCPQITPCGHVFAFHSIMQHLMTQVTGCLKLIACVLCIGTLSLLKMCTLCLGHVQLLDALASKLRALVKFAHHALIFLHAAAWHTCQLKIIVIVMLSSS